MFERFTDRARRVLTLAQEEARVLQQSGIGTGHLLLGLLGEGYGIPAQVLVEEGVTLESARAQVTALLPRGPEAPTFTEGAKKALELALRASVTTGAEEIRTEHLFLGLLRVPGDTAHQVLTARGTDPAALDAQVLERSRANDPESGASRRRLGHAYPLPRVVDLPPGTPRPGVGPLGAAPRCPSCGAGLAGRLAYRRTDAEDADGVDPALPLVVVHCGACGTGLGVVPDYLE